MTGYCGCKCDSKGNTAGAKYQDAQFGVGVRLFTHSDKPGAKSRCTVCGNAKNAPSK